MEVVQHQVPFNCLYNFAKSLSRCSCRAKILLEGVLLPFDSESVCNKYTMYYAEGSLYWVKG